MFMIPTIIIASITFVLITLSVLLFPLLFGEFLLTKPNQLKSYGVYEFTPKA